MRFYQCCNLCSKPLYTIGKAVKTASKGILSFFETRYTYVQPAVKSFSLLRCVIDNTKYIQIGHIHSNVELVDLEFSWEIILPGTKIIV